ncbi:MAG: phosphoribosylformylglycinamidine cyclo-ligase [Actinobacteria bacterium]|uniref:phosphoribosylformylglycinamidine cyclo-ligase n=1 Tax=freshwater metagenome TaxID=449393 RepID=A0A6J7DHI8_9ZZZZ|nr:phosphoribosylformylglycinamidine cyclo-ligase [Actinomycetota bacterium]
MSDAYSDAGVNVREADAGVAAIVSVLARINTGSPSRVVPLPGHFAAVLKLTDTLGLAICTDGVGSKLVVAEQLGMLDSVGIDCVAMNVNDLVCVGAEPIALVDYLAVEESDPDRLGAIAEGLRRGAELAGVEIPGGELAQIPELIRGHPSPEGFDLCAAAVGTVDLNKIIDGSGISPGQVLIGVPSSGVHSNGLTLARKALLENGDPHERPEVLGGASLAEALLVPTAIYVRAALELLRSDLDPTGLFHLTGGGLLNLLRLGTDIGYRIDQPLEPQPVYGLIAERGAVPVHEMYEVFNMGCGFAITIAAEQAADAVAVFDKHHPGTRVIGEVTAESGAVTVPGLGIVGDETGLRGS